MADDVTLTDLLHRIDAAAAGDNVSVQDVLDRIGDRSIMPVVLVMPSSAPRKRAPVASSLNILISFLI